MANILVAKVVGGVASGIGLVSEGISAKKRRSAMKKDNAEYNDDIAGPSQPPSYDEVLDEGDEEKWDLDDAQDELERTAGPGPQSPAGKPIRNVHKLTDAFMARHPVPECIDEAPKLQLPVVLPQRRPKDRRRGFIRAYAPALETKGIDQATFLEFIETFDKASQASPWIQAINLAGFATIALAPPFSILVSIAIQTTVNVATEVHSRTRTNTFLDRANNEFFRPRGLYCLVMTWNPESDQRTDTIDITSSILSKTTSSSSTTQKLKSKLKSSDGNTYGDLEFPEVAPLVFPALDELADQTGEEAATKREKLKRAKNFTSEYFDRRAVAKYAGENPNSVLASHAGPKPTFSSRYADPNHPAASGNLISLVTGGYINPPSLGSGGSGRGFGGGRGGMGGQTDMHGRQGFGGGLGGRGIENTGMGMLIGSLVDRGRTANGDVGNRQRYHANDRHDLQQERKPMTEQGRGTMIQQPTAGFGQGRGGGFGGIDNPIAALNPIMGIKRMLKERVLYLMIVNMPSDEELAAAAREIERAR